MRCSGAHSAAQIHVGPSKAAAGQLPGQNEQGTAATWRSDVSKPLPVPVGHRCDV